VFALHYIVWFLTVRNTQIQLIIHALAPAESRCKRLKKFYIDNFITKGMLLMA